MTRKSFPVMFLKLALRRGIYLFLIILQAKPVSASRCARGGSSEKSLRDSLDMKLLNAAGVTSFFISSKTFCQSSDLSISAVVLLK